MKIRLTQIRRYYQFVKWEDYQKGYVQTDKHTLDLFDD